MVHMTDPTGTEILDLPMNPRLNDAKATSIRGYFRALLAELLREGEGFSGKRPFGNSSWEYELYLALYIAGHIEGNVTFYDRDYDKILPQYGPKVRHVEYNDIDDREGDRLLQLAVKAL